MPRKKATPHKRVREPSAAAQTDGEQAAPDEGGAQQEGARQTQGRGQCKRPRVGEPPAVQSVAAGSASDGELLGFADLLFCAPVVEGTAVPGGDGAGVAGPVGGPVAEAAPAPATPMALAPGALLATASASPALVLPDGVHGAI